MSETTRTGRKARTESDVSDRQKTPVSDNDRADWQDNRADSTPENPPVAPDSSAVGDDQRVMADGGRDALDPRRFTTNWSPAVIFGEVDRLFVADVQTLPNGWVRAKRWDQSKVKIPPHAVHRIEYVETETYTPDGEPQTYRQQRIVDDDALEEAHRLAQPTVEADTDQEAIADD